MPELRLLHHHGLPIDGHVRSLHHPIKSRCARGGGRAGGRGWQAEGFCIGAVVGDVVGELGAGGRKGHKRSELVARPVQNGLCECV